MHGTYLLLVNESINYKNLIKFFKHWQDCNYKADVHVYENKLTSTKSHIMKLIQNLKVFRNGSFFPDWVFIWKGRNWTFQKCDVSLKFRYRPPNDFLVSSLQICFDHSCVKYASYELHQMTKEDLSFTNMCQLSIILHALWRQLKHVKIKKGLYQRDSSREHSQRKHNYI